MKTFFTLITLCAALSFNCSAQSANQDEKARPQVNAEALAKLQVNAANRQTDQMKERLNLNAKQEKAIRKINLKYADLRVQTIEAAKKENSNIPTLMGQLEEKREQEILPLLDNDQTATYNAMKKEQEERREKMQQTARQR